MIAWLVHSAHTHVCMYVCVCVCIASLMGAEANIQQEKHRNTTAGHERIISMFSIQACSHSQRGGKVI